MTAVLAEAFALPDEEERDYLLAGLSRLAALRGPEPLVAAPLLLPRPAYWPDPVPARGHGAAVLLRRLLAYAGLGELGVAIEVGAERPRELVDEGEHDGSEPLRHAAGWFMGIDDGVCHFGLSDSTLRDEELLIGTLGHEVAHAYREYHRLVVADRDTEELLTDLTTVYLGFGFFALQSSFRFKTGHYDGSGRRLLFERQALGYLRPGQLALLLAAQLVVRNRAPELEQVLESLSPNQADVLARAHAELMAEREHLIQRLKLPAPATWPAPRELSEIVRPLAPAVIRVADHAAEQRRGAELWGVAFAVRGDYGRHAAGVGAALGFCSFLVGADVYMWLLLPALATVGYKLGRRWECRHCSSCGHAVGRGDDRCDSCDTPLVGVIADPADRFEAEERYRAGG